MISIAYIFTIILISKLSVEMACLLGIQNEMQAVWAKYAETFGTFETYVIFIQNFSMLEKYLIRSFRMYAVPSSLKRL